MKVWGAFITDFDGIQMPPVNGTKRRFDMSALYRKALWQATSDEGEELYVATMSLPRVNDNEILIHMCSRTGGRDSSPFRCLPNSLHPEQSLFDHADRPRKIGQVLLPHASLVFAPDYGGHAVHDLAVGISVEHQTADYGVVLS